MRLLRIGLIVAGAALAFACSAADEDAAASGTALNQANAPESDAGPAAPLAAIDTTPLTLDGAGRLVSYSPAAPFNAFTLSATAGTKLRILVDARTAGTKPEIFLTNAGFVTLSSSSTGSGTAFLRSSRTPACRSSRSRSAERLQLPRFLRAQAVASVFVETSSFR